MLGLGFGLGSHGLGLGLDMCGLVNITVNDVGGVNAFNCLVTRDERRLMALYSPPDEHNQAVLFPSTITLTETIKRLKITTRE